MDLCPLAPNQDTNMKCNCLQISICRIPRQSKLELPSNYHKIKSSARAELTKLVRITHIIAVRVHIIKILKTIVYAISRRVQKQVHKRSKLSIMFNHQDPWKKTKEKMKLNHNLYPWVENTKSFYRIRHIKMINFKYMMQFLPILPNSSMRVSMKTMNFKIVWITRSHMYLPISTYPSIR